MWFQRQPSYLVALTLLNTAGCGTILRLPAIPNRPASDYQLSQESAGLIAAVDPMVDSKRVADFFGLDLLSVGLLPVLVVVENHHEQDVFVVKRALVSVALESSEAASAGFVLTKGRSTQLAGATGALASVLFTPLIIGLPTAIVLSHFTEVEAVKLRLIKDNVERKELLERTVYPGEAHRGFVYFNFDKQAPLNGLVAVKVSVERLRTRENVTFDFYLDAEEVKRP